MIPLLLVFGNSDVFKYLYGEQRKTKVLKKWAVFTMFTK